MDFDLSPRVTELRDRIRAFMGEHVYPNELEALRALDEEVTVESGRAYPEILVEIRERAKAEGLWNLFMPDEQHGVGLTNWEYGVLCEEMGRSPAVAPMAFNCAAPDTGNMEILAEHGSEEQKERWLRPLLDGEIRSCFSMTEPEVSGSDPTTLQTRAELEGGEWVINGHKWFTSGAVGASVAIAMVVTDPDAHPYARASQILVPTDAPGFNLIRPVPVMGHDGGPGHCEIRFEDCRVPEENLLGPRQAGFVIAQDRLGPGRIHHCMRAIGSCERAIEMMCKRANEREAFGGKLAEKQFVQDFIAKSRIETEHARLLTLMAAWKMDTHGKKEARREISMIKVVAANVVMDVLDRAIQVHGSLGMSDDTPLAGMWRFSRMLKVADGPDEVHKMVVARRELNHWAKAAEAENGTGARAAAEATP
ncbi:MAG TPA: acyl-CoA dehydrogenase family protein [Solirubrobacterales bacterium]|nr:acyl-CoA dehydrogenase family protein [Solirubrobacterales bacterium]